ncbi:MAG TPA: Crp/Fnr family transcriptional regulator [Streptosporangiaceae bacterium]
MGGPDMGDQKLGKMLLSRIDEGNFHAPIRKLAPYVHLYSWGDTGDWLYLVQRGWVKSLTWSWEGKPCLLAISGPADLLGVSGFLTGQRTETVMTKTPTQIRVIAHDQFHQILADLGLRAAWHDYLTSRIAEQQEALTYFVTLDSEHRLATTLLRLARKFGVQAENGLRINCKMTQDELAQMVGTTRSRIGYFLKCFEGKKIIEKRSSVLVIDEGRLLDYLLTCP